MVNKIQFLLSLCATSVLTLGSSAGFAATACPDPGQYPSNGCSLPGVANGSFPYFTQSVDVTLKNKKEGDFKLTASYGGDAPQESDFSVSDAVDDIHGINNTSFEFKARSKSGDLTGFVKIRGKLAGSNSQQLLMSADLDGDWDSSGQLIDKP